MGILVFLTGDFNSPSYLDWTEEADASRDDMPYPVEWPVSKALADAGFKDSYRAANPDPVARPGFTWTPGGPESAKHEVHDRIDWVLSTGPATATVSSVVGEAGNENVDISIPMWPSDHRSVVSTFRVTPSPTPSFVAAEARAYQQGDEVSVRYHAKPGETVVIRSPSGSKIDATDRRINRRTVSTASRPTAPTGEYDVDSSTAAARWNTKARRSSHPPGTEASITTSKKVQGRRADRVSGRIARHEVGLDVVFPARAGSQPARGGLWRRLPATATTLYEYTHTIEGSTTSARNPGRGRSSLRYDVRLLVDDSYAGGGVRALRNRQALAARVSELVLAHPERHEPCDEGDEEDAAEERLDDRQRLGQADRG